MYTILYKNDKNSIIMIRKRKKYKNDRKISRIVFEQFLIGFRTIRKRIDKNGIRNGNFATRFHS